MKTLLILLAVCSFSISGLAQSDDSWKSPFAWYNQETAEKAKDILKEKKSLMLNEGCATGWGAITISYLKKAKVVPFDSGEEGYYKVLIKVETSDDKVIESQVRLDSIKVKDDSGNWVHLAKLMGIEGEYCRANEE